MDRPELHHEAFDHELALLKAEERIGVDVGFIRRRPRKIEPLQLLKAVLHASSGKLSVIEGAGNGAQRSVLGGGLEAGRGQANRRALGGVLKADACPSPLQAA